MRKLLTSIVVLLLGVSGMVAVSQEFQNYQYWPALYQAAENLYVKQGRDFDTGGSTDSLYFRIGWGPCLRIRMSELTTFDQVAPVDRYMNLRDYADSVENPEWNEVDKLNCPSAPKVVKSTWRESRPTYDWRYDEAQDQWERGSKTQWRVVAVEPFVHMCQNRYVARKDSGDRSNYYALATDAEVYLSSDNTVTARVFELADVYPNGLLTVCEDTPESVADYRY